MSIASYNLQQEQQKKQLPPQARVGIGVFVLRRSASEPHETEFIIGQRLGSHGSGTWALPGGHLEFGESFEACAAREVLEETGLRISDMRFLTATNDIMPDAGRHYVTVFVVSRRVDDNAEPVLCEPDKCRVWKWIRWSKFVRWARSEMRVVHGGEGRKGEEQEVFDGKLFSALLAIVQQRREVVPSVEE